MFPVELIKFRTLVIHHHLIVFGHSKTSLSDKMRLGVLPSQVLTVTLRMDVVDSRTKASWMLRDKGPKKGGKSKQNPMGYLLNLNSKHWNMGSMMEVYIYIKHHHFISMCLPKNSKGMSRHSLDDIKRMI